MSCVSKAHRICTRFTKNPQARQYLLQAGLVNEFQVRSSLRCFAGGARRRRPVSPGSCQDAWKEVQDPAGSGATYWWNQETNETTALGTPRPNTAATTATEAMPAASASGLRKRLVNPTVLGGAMATAAVGSHVLEHSLPTSPYVMTRMCQWPYIASWQRMGWSAVFEGSHLFHHVEQQRLRLIRCKGDSFGRGSLRLTLMNAVAEETRVEIPKGTLFIPDNDYEQTLITCEDTEILIRGGDHVNLELDAYCGISDGACPHGNMQITALQAPASHVGSQLAVWNWTDAFGRPDIQLPEGTRPASQETQILEREYPNEDFSKYRSPSEEVESTEGSRSPHPSEPPSPTKDSWNFGLGWGTESSKSSTTSSWGRETRSSNSSSTSSSGFKKRGDDDD